MGMRQERALAEDSILECLRRSASSKPPGASPVGFSPGSPLARLETVIPKPARFPSGETRSDSASALLSLRSRNPPRSGFDGLSHPSLFPFPPTVSNARCGFIFRDALPILFLFILINPSQELRADKGGRLGQGRPPNHATHRVWAYLFDFEEAQIF